METRILRPEVRSRTVFSRQIWVFRVYGNSMENAKRVLPESS